MSEEVTVTDENFADEVKKSSLPVLVDFWAEWCVPCKSLSPLVEEIAGEQKGKLKVASAQVDECPEVAREFGIISIPTLMVFKDGEMVAQKVGAVPKEEIEALFQDYL